MPATVLQSGPGYRNNWATAMAAPQSSKDLIAEGGYLLDPLKIGQDNRTTIMVSLYSSAFIHFRTLMKETLRRFGTFLTSTTSRCS